MRIESSENLEAEEIIRGKIKEFNNASCSYFTELTRREIKQNFFVYDEEKLIGAALGVVRYNWYFLDILFIEEIYRKQHLGTKLMQHIETFSKSNGLTGVRLETWDFQALGFYKANGYEVFGQIKDCPPGTIEYHLKKEF